MELSDAIALLALVVSITTAIYAWWRSRRGERTADVYAYFHWLQSRARVELPSGEVMRRPLNRLLL
jgi:hypothetical protein